MKTFENRQNMLTRHRIHFLDNLRTFIIFLVVLCHAGGVYESGGTWASFWIVDDPSTNHVAGMVFLLLDIFMMPTLFFISGYFAPLSRAHKTGWGFLTSKFKRLMVPWMIAVVTLIPLYKVIFLTSRNLPQESWTTYFHWSNGIWGQNWLWFLPVLFLFNGLYVLVSKATARMPGMSLKVAVLSTGLIGFVYSLGMDRLGLRGWTKIGLLDFQNERILIYFMAFLLGALCFKKKVFELNPDRKKFYILVLSLAWVPINLYVWFLLIPWLNPGHYVVSETIHKMVLWVSYQLSLLCLVYLMIETFRRYQDKTGKIRNALSRNSYDVYIIHVIVTGAIALAMLHTGMPSLVKFLLLTISTFVVSHLISYGCRTCVGPRIVNLINDPCPDCREVRAAISSVEN